MILRRLTWNSSFRITTIEIFDKEYRTCNLICTVAKLRIYLQFLNCTLQATEHGYFLNLLFCPWTVFALIRVWLSFTCDCFFLGQTILFVPLLCLTNRIMRGCLHQLAPVDDSWSLHCIYWIQPYFCKKCIEKWNLSDVINEYSCFHCITVLYSSSDKFTLHFGQCSLSFSLLKEVEIVWLNCRPVVGCMVGLWTPLTQILNINDNNFTIISQLDPLKLLCE